MTMNFFKQYENDKIKREKTVKAIIETFEVQDDLDTSTEKNFSNKIDELDKTIKEFKEVTKNKIRETTFDSDPYFDSEIIKNLQNLHEYICRYIPDYPAYYNEETGKINGQAFLDSRDFLKQAIGITPETILETETTATGIFNDNKIYFDNGFSMDSEGNIYDADLTMIFKTKEPVQKIKYLDLLNEKIVTDNGIRIDMPKDFINENFINNPKVPERKKKRYKELKGEEIIEKNEPIIGKYINNYIYKSDKNLFELKPEVDLFVGDIFDEKIDLIEQIKRYKIEESTFGICNFQQIPYARLNSLLFWGGGERGVKPLSSNEISDKDIIFKPDGTAMYTGRNSTISTHRSGCKSKTYKTGHVAMYSKSNPVGLKRGIIQYIYGFCARMGLFNANIPMLIGFKKIKVFRGLCIGGLLEQALCSWQQKISTEINELFQCKPSEMPSDRSETCFENFTYPHGSSVKTLENLDKLKSVKVMDRFVVNLVEPKVTGLKNFACGIFFYDPENKLTGMLNWRYGDWSGKPFTKENVIPIKNGNGAYNNPLVKELLSGDANGSDGITRKLMSLQFAFMKKQELLNIKDIETSMDANLDSVIYDTLDKLSQNIGNFLYMKSYDLGKSKVKGFETKSFTYEFIKHFNYLIVNNIRKEIDLKACLRRYTEIISSGSGENSSTTTRIIEYYDFSGYDPNEYLVPERKYVELYDEVMFSEMHVSNKDLMTVYNENLKLIKKVHGGVEKFSKVKTIRDFINISDFKDAYLKDIEDNLYFIQKELEYEEYEAAAFEQVKKRCYYTINNKKIFNK